jgi:hypothetical protein
VAAVLRRKLGARADGLPLGGVLRTARAASLEDPFLFFLALSMAERELVLSCPAVDERGTATVPSPFIDEVEACLADDLPRSEVRPGALVPAVVDCCEPAELVARAALDRWTEPAPGGLAAALRAGLADGAARLAAIDRRAAIEVGRSTYFLTPRGGLGKEALADAWVGRLVAAGGLLAERIGAMRWSPTRLEALGACGFKFFAARLLGLPDRREPEVDVAAAEQGTLFHHVLAEFFRAHPVLPADREAARALGRTFLSAIHAAAPRAIPAKDPHFLGLTWARLEAALDELILEEHAQQEARLHDGVAVERRLEEEFTCHLPDPAGAAPLVLTGTPDRIEVHRRGPEVVAVRVVDYKVTRERSGYRGRLDSNKALGRTSFQIPVYLLGALAASPPGFGPDTVLEGGYVLVLAEGAKHYVKRIPSPLLDAGALTPDGEPTLPERIRSLVAQAAAGRFDVDPEPCDPSCAYRTVCRYEPPPLEEDAGDAGRD